MQTFLEVLASDRRLAILRILNDLKGSANDSSIHQCLAGLGHKNETRKTIRGDIRFLIDHGLIVDEWLGDVQICEITRRGVDVASGLEYVEGIKKPGIGR